MTWFGIHTIVTDEGIGPAVLGPAVEERGFTGLFLGEHSHVPVRRETPIPPGETERMLYRALDPFVTLGVVAARTRTLLLGTGVCVLVQRDTIQTAKDVASLDWVSGGRVVFGVGVGWLREEMRNHGTDLSRRGALLDEQVAAMTAIWSRERAEFHGRQVGFDPIFAWPKPVQQPRPPVYVGGGLTALDHARRLGGGWMPNGSIGIEGVTAAMATAPGVPVIVNNVPPDPGVVAGYRDMGVTGITFHIPPQPEAACLRTLDGLATLAA